MTKPGSKLISRYITAIHWFIPIEAQQNAAQLTRAQNVINAVVMAALSGPLYALAYYLLGFTIAAQEILTCCAFMFVTPFLLRMTRSIVVAREVFLCAVFFNFTWLTFHLGGVNAPTAGWLITAPVVAMFLGGVGTAVFWLAMSCLAAGGVYALPMLGMALPAHPVRDMDLLYLLCDVGLYMVIVVFVLLFELTKTQGFIKLEQALNVINELAIRDELTGTHNRRHLIGLIEHERERVMQGCTAFCVCLLDIDFFKRINDTYGHAAGDVVLRMFALTVQNQIRDTDAFGRYGGEEFLLMLPATSLEDAMAFAERVRQQIEKLAFPDVGNELQVSVSIGVAQFRAGETIGQTITRADEALYVAKSVGRNRVVNHGQTIEFLLREQTVPMSTVGAPAVDNTDSSECDPLTGLLGRRVLRDRLGHAMARAVRNERSVGLMLLNLNKFKDINEALGFEAGDAILVQVAANVRQCLRESDTVVRWGGDEFIVILEDLAQPADAQQVAEKILDRFALPLQACERECFVSLSIGIAIFPAPGCDIDTLLKRTDTAMTRAKLWGENCVQIYSSDAPLPPSERLLLKNHLREALAHDQLLLEYQPQVEGDTGRIVGVEALIRWNHPQYGRIEPGRFITLAEETGLIVPIGEWVLRTACRQQKAWRDAGLPALKMAVNLSARQLKHPELVGRVLDVIAETGIDPSCLDLEITESILIDNMEMNQIGLGVLRQAGVKISIDDFGTGYSSLSYLTELPADILKMDRSFVMRLGQGDPGARSYALAESIIHMAHRLQLTVIAEAVETPEQLADLRAMGCDYAQGYLFHRPQDPDRVAALLRTQMDTMPSPTLRVA
ncbi:diguanylate cyclase domain-containing protein [Massilia sp. 9096]|uniref:diguanylate cyclase domain-containing protein n=1 Tax=Massilia sp. 9096 TaxID=1500894 RepID=UPI00056C759F|nr:diguanylate cyclase [Massilia sp. 9096]